ncbi:MAG: YwaF family protein [Clostridia bacterium]|nr:YwaF family protein [Clostridia bacterium]
MPAKLYGIEHFTYIGITVALACISLLFAKKYLKSEKSQSIFLKSVAVGLFISILMNRLSQVFRYETVRWEQIIPDSYCGLTSLVLSLAVLFGKKDNDVLHFVWILGLFGGISTVVYPSFIDQGPTIFYLPTISGLLHHSFCATLVVALLLFNQIHITYKKWYCTFFGFTCYLSLGAFLIGYFGLSDAFHIYTPLLDGTPLTTWGMAPIYVVCYALLLFIIELVRKNKGKKTLEEKTNE